jgi:hypothetical protein
VLGDDAFQGDYFAVLKAGGHAAAATQARGTTGILVADGAGVAVHSQTINDSGVVSGPTTTPYGFDVAADGTLELSIGSTVFGRGGLSTDGRCALLCSVSPGAFPGIIVLHRREGQYANASLSGAYRFVAFSFFTVTASSSSVTASVLFDGVGGMTGSATVNSMGTVLAGSLPASTYSVIADGTSVLALGVTSVVEGGVVDGGSAAIWGGSTTGTSSPAMFVAVKEAASTTVATLQGAYWAVAIERDPVSDEFRSLHGTATADGAGGLTLLATVNTEGVLAPEPLQSTVYAVTASGQLTIDPAGSALVGGVTQDGSFAAVAGGTTPGSNPILLILRRK